MCHKTCIFCFFPTINKYLCVAKHSLLSRWPSYKNINKIYLEQELLVCRVIRLLDGPPNKRSSISGSDNTFFFTPQQAFSRTLHNMQPHKQRITRGLSRIPPLRILYAFMVCTGTSAPFLPTNTSFGKKLFLRSYPFTSHSRNSQHITVSKSSTTFKTRQWQFEFDPNSRHAKRSLFSIL